MELKICFFHKWGIYTDRSPVVYKQCEKCNKIKIVSITPIGYEPHDLKVDIGK